MPETPKASAMEPMMGSKNEPKGESSRTTAMATSDTTTKVDAIFWMS